jgi:hypothetical protein
VTRGELTTFRYHGRREFQQALEALAQRLASAPPETQFVSDGTLSPEEVAWIMQRVAQIRNGRRMQA